MKGLLFITISDTTKPPWFNHADIPYFGFNAGHGIELWRELEEWNEVNPENKVIKDEGEDSISLAEVDNVKKYVDFITAKHGDKFYLIKVDENFDDNIGLKDFDFIGYDCGYIYGDDHRDWYSLFSCIKNELLKEPEYINPFLLPSFSKLNQYGLFQSYKDALAFKTNRDTAITQRQIDGIEIAFKQFGILRIFLYEKLNPLLSSTNKFPHPL